jgi:SAM-dependent methyltransferase
VAEPVSSGLYSSEYFRAACGGSEYFERYGPKIVKPAHALALKEAGLTPGMAVLDVGCGRGEILFQARERGCKAIGTDYASAGVALARETSGAPVLLCDAKFLPFKDSCFDRIFLLGVMDHLHPWELRLCFDEFKRVLKPDGVVVIHTCVNRLYFKTLTYGARAAAARVLGLRAPAPPRSDEDASLHVNEHSLFRLRAFFGSIGWKAEVRPVPNPKLMVAELYGETLPAGFPLRPAPAWKRALYRGLLFRPPLSAFLAREFFALARP